MRKTIITIILTILSITLLNFLFQARYWRLFRDEYKRIEVCFDRGHMDLDDWCPYISNDNGITISSYPK